MTKLVKTYVKETNEIKQVSDNEYNCNRVNHVVTFN